MKTKEHSRQVREKDMVKIKAGLGYKTKMLWTSHGALFHPPIENGKSMAHLQTYHVIALSINIQARPTREATKRPMVAFGGAAEITPHPHPISSLKWFMTKFRSPIYHCYIRSNWAFGSA
ncbi:hypothetical protein AMECASPLE_018618 [Ameca splendens]|uniref:Uncharacterized protein n=1 Tax=Ameca splendens TaxID=208324 RepID=A0ABV0ZML1_9TELE